MEGKQEGTCERLAMYVQMKALRTRKVISLFWHKRMSNSIECMCGC
jgi:hypothetical protein